MQEAIHKVSGFVCMEVFYLSVCQEWVHFTSPYKAWLDIGLCACSLLSTVGLYVWVRVLWEYYMYVSVCIHMNKRKYSVLLRVSRK